MAASASELPSAASDAPQRQVAGQPDVGVGQAAQADERRRPRADAGDGEQRRGRPPRGRRRGRARRRRRRARSASAVHGAPAGAGQPDRGRGRRRRAPSGRGKAWVSVPTGSGSGRARGGSSRAVSVRAPATDTCWPRTARTASSAASGEAGTRRPGAPATSGGQRRVGAEHVVDGGGVGVEVEHPPAAGDRRPEVAQLGQPQPGGDRRRRRPGRGRAGRRRARAAGRARGRTSSRPTPRGRGRRARRGSSRTSAASYGARAASRRVSQPGAPPVGAAGRPAAARWAWSAKTSRTVSLNCRMLAKPGGEGDVGHRQVGGLDQQPRGLRPLRPGERQRADAELGDEQPVQLALGVAERGRPARGRRRARPRRRRSAAWPGRRRRRGRPTRASRGRRRAGSGGRRGSRRAWAAGRGGEEARRCAPAGVRAGQRRAAVDAGGAHGGEEPAVEARVPAGDRAVAALVVGRRRHGTSMAPAGDGHWRFSDTAVRAHPGRSDR